MLGKTKKETWVDGRLRYGSSSADKVKQSLKPKIKILHIYKYRRCIWGVFDPFVILVSLDAFTSKWPVTQKELVLEQSGLKFGTQLLLVYNRAYR